MPDALNLPHVGFTLIQKLGLLLLLTKKQNKTISLNLRQTHY